MLPSLWDLFCDWLKANKPDNWRSPQPWIIQRGQEHGYRPFGVLRDKIVAQDVILLAADPEFFEKLSVEIDKYKDIRFAKLELEFTGSTILDPGYIYAPYIPLQQTPKII